MPLKASPKGRALKAGPWQLLGHARRQRLGRSCLIAEGHAIENSHRELVPQAVLVVFAERQRPARGWAEVWESLNKLGTFVGLDVRLQLLQQVVYLSAVHCPHKIPTRFTGGVGLMRYARHELVWTRDGIRKNRQLLV